MQPALEETPYQSSSTPIEIESPQKQPRDNYLLHGGLFLLTVLTTLMAGAEFMTNRNWFAAWYGHPEQQLTLQELGKGFPYAFAFLLFLTCHEFGHYFLARIHKVWCSLPYYIPVFLPLPILNIGSMGAVIRIRQRPRTSQEYFDIGIAGPLAGFIVAVGLLWWGFSHLPPLEYLYQMNPYEKEFGHVPTQDELLTKYGSALAIGNSLLFHFFETCVADPARLPNHLELIHYPFLFVGFITLFFTALNLLPIGQLDGGHVTYGLFGRRRAGLISRIFVVGMLVYGGMGVADFHQPRAFLYLSIYLLYLVFLCSRILPGSIPRMLALVGGIVLLQQAAQLAVLDLQPNFLWLFYSFVAVRLTGLDHPPALRELALDRRRIILGWVAIAIFILCFTPAPLYLLANSGNGGVFTLR